MRIAFDTGGMFTDCVYLRGGRLEILKVPSTPRKPSEAITIGVSFFSGRALSTDNAAMIAAAAYPDLLAGDLASSDLNAEPNLRLA